MNWIEHRKRSNNDTSERTPTYDLYIIDDMTPTCWEGFDFNKVDNLTTSAFSVIFGTKSCTKWLPKHRSGPVQNGHEVPQKLFSKFSADILVCDMFKLFLRCPIRCVQALQSRLWKPGKQIVMNMTGMLNVALQKLLANLTLVACVEVGSCREVDVAWRSRHRTQNRTHSLVSKVLQLEAWKLASKSRAANSKQRSSTCW